MSGSELHTIEQRIIQINNELSDGDEMLPIIALSGMGYVFAKRKAGRNLGFLGALIGGVIGSKLKKPQLSAEEIQALKTELKDLVSKYKNIQQLNELSKSGEVSAQAIGALTFDSYEFTGGFSALIW